MKRPRSADSFAGEEEEKCAYGRGGTLRLASILDGLDDDDCGDADLCGGGGGGGCAGGEKKRRLSVEQVRALERSFEVENKLEPERKARLAQDLGLQPRQVAVWFQNRRARWKTKQLERDYTALRSTYDALQLDHDALRRDKEALLHEIEELKAKLSADDCSSSIKHEVNPKSTDEPSPAPPALIYKDGSSDSDSSAVLNGDDNSPCRRVIHSPIFPPLQLHHRHRDQERDLGDAGMNASSSSPSSPFEFKAQRGGAVACYQQHPMMKMEEAASFEDEEPCSSFFSDEQPPTLSWWS